MSEGLHKHPNKNLEKIMTFLGPCSDDVRRGLEEYLTENFTTFDEDYDEREQDFLIKSLEKYIMSIKVFHDFHMKFNEIKQSPSKEYAELSERYQEEEDKCKKIRGDVTQGVAEFFKDQGAEKSDNALDFVWNLAYCWFSYYEKKDK